MEQTKQEQAMSERVLDEMQRTNALLAEILETLQPTGALHVFTSEESEELHGSIPSDDRKEITVRDRIEVLRIASENQIGGVESILEGYQRIMAAISGASETHIGEAE